MGVHIYSERWIRQMRARGGHVMMCACLQYCVGTKVARNHPGAKPRFLGFCVFSTKPLPRSTANV
jgi:hypothetical protein